MLADYHSSCYSWLALSKIMYFSSSMEIFFICWLEEASQKYLSISVSAHFYQYGDVSGEEGKDTANISPCIFPSSTASAGVYIRPRIQQKEHTRSGSEPPALQLSKVPKPPRLRNPVGKAKQAQAALSAQSGPYRQHLCGRIPSTSPWAEGCCSCGCGEVRDGRCRGGSARFWAWEECRLSGQNPSMYRFQKVCFLHQ